MNREDRFQWLTMLCPAIIPRLYFMDSHQELQPVRSTAASLDTVEGPFDTSNPVLMIDDVCYPLEYVFISKPLDR